MSFRGVIGHDLYIPDQLLDELLSALRRHDPKDADRVLTDWGTAQPDLSADDGVDWAWDGDEILSTYLDDQLTAWVHAEIRLHVDGGRFEHALCLAERYRRPLTAEDMANFNPTGAIQ